MIFVVKVSINSLSKYGQGIKYLTLSRFKLISLSLPPPPLSLSIYIYIYICVCVYIYIYIYTHTHTYTYTHVVFCEEFDQISKVFSTCFWSKQHLINHYKIYILFSYPSAHLSSRVVGYGCQDPKLSLHLIVQHSYGLFCFHYYHTTRTNQSRSGHVGGK